MSNTSDDMSVAGVAAVRLDPLVSTSHVDANKIGDHGYRLIPLKTTTELRAGDALVDVYITQVPPKSASAVLKYARWPFSFNLICIYVCAYYLS